MVKRGRGRPKKISPDNLTDRGKRMEKCEDIPEFFKIYVPAMCTDSMRIPPEFIKKIGGNIPRIARLTREPGLLSWQVSVSRNDEHWFLGEGWAEFVQENSVENGDFLTFSYVGNSTFSVKVFGPNGCRKSIEDRSSIKYGKSTENDLQGDDGTSESG
ncbi:putative B3 domain-containing protein [Sesamum alatum]|uniref:B3 domain-containing protein n=1 Tax=Sesamum alatum TaxID=300844 RepID=A0AAE1XLW0_9LAMI|nr:putative B3 domain-containing protein [Sesamum alatum]